MNFLSNANLIGDRHPNLMVMIMFKTGVNVPSREGMWRPQAAIFGTFIKKNFNTRWIHGSVVIVEVTKYLHMSI